MEALGLEWGRESRPRESEQLPLVAGLWRLTNFWLAGVGMSMTAGGNDSVVIPCAKARIIVGGLAAFFYVALFFTSAPNKTLTASKPSSVDDPRSPIPDRRSNNQTANQTRQPAPPMPQTRSK